MQVCRTNGSIVMGLACDEINITDHFKIFDTSNIFFVKFQSHIIIFRLQKIGFPKSMFIPSRANLITMEPLGLQT